MIGGDPNDPADLRLTALIMSTAAVARDTEKPSDVVAAWEAIYEGLKRWVPEPRDKRRRDKRRRDHGLGPWQVAAIITEMERPREDRRLPVAHLLGAASALTSAHLDTRCVEAFGDPTDQKSPCFQALLWMSAPIGAVLRIPGMETT